MNLEPDVNFVTFFLRQAILRGQILPRVVASGCKTSSRLARLKMANGRVMVTPARMLRPRGVSPRKEVGDEREMSVSPLVSESEKGID